MMVISERKYANAMRMVNKNKVETEEVLQMGLSSCNVRCIATHIAKGNVISKVNV